MNDNFFDLKREKQDRMINGGLKVFARNGYRHASTDEIVREAGISKGLLFHYFISKVGMYTFLIDYSVRFLSLEISRTVRKEEENYWEICKQIEFAKLQILKKYPYMNAFLERVFVEFCEEAWPEAVRQKHYYRRKIEECFDSVGEHPFGEGVDTGKVKGLVRYTVRGIEQEALLQEEILPEDIYSQVCQYLDFMKGVWR